MDQPPQETGADQLRRPLHNQSALRPAARLLQLPGVVVIDVPYRLGSREVGWLAADRSTAGTAAASRAELDRPDQPTP